MVVSAVRCHRALQYRKRIQRLLDVFRLSRSRYTRPSGLTGLIQSPFTPFRPIHQAPSYLSRSSTLYPHHRCRLTVLASFLLNQLTHPLHLLAPDRVQDAVQKKINLAEGDSGENRRWEIQGELDDIRSKQSENKLNRGKVFDQLKALQERTRKRVRHFVPSACPASNGHAHQIHDLNASRAKTKFRSVEEVDAHIR